MTKRIIVDITQLYHWTGKLTGIPRVMYELTSWLVKDTDYEVKTVVWDAAAGYVYEVEWSGEGEYRERSQTALEEPAEPPVDAKSHLYRVMRKLYDSSPEPAKRVARHAKSLATGSNKHDTVIKGDQPPAFVFHAGDKFIVMWGEWADPQYSAYLQGIPKNGEVSLYQIAYDMIPLLLPQFSGHSTDPLARYITEVYPHCANVLCISQNTIQDVREWMSSQSLSVPKLSFMRLGDDFAATGEEMPAHSFFSRDEPYIMTLGTIEARKNHTILYYVYKLAHSRGVSLPPVVIVGRRGWMTENIYEFMTKDPEVKDKFIFIHDATDSQLSWIMSRAKFTVYPSFYEGWGLPVAESIVRGIPCVTTSSSSIPEVVGDAALYFNPASTDECLAAIQEMMKDEVYAMMRERAKQYKMTSWDTTYMQMKEGIDG